MKKKRTYHCLFEKMREGKFFLTMRLTIVLTIILSLNSFGGVLSQNVSLKCENVSLREVFRSLKQQTGKLFVYNEEELDKAAQVSVDADNIALSSVLDRVLSGLPYRYEIINDMVVIKPSLGKNSVQEETKKLIEVKGIVRDCKNAPLPGVSVLIKGTMIGVATNMAGEFMIMLEAGKCSLLFSFIGMKTKEVVWNGQQNLKVMLEDDCVGMDEVVVTGYQTIDKRKLTSAISSLTEKDLDFRGALTVDQMLEGKIPGLLSMTMSSTPGAATKMRLRGSSTFTGTREPLWVIDGIIYENPVPLSADEINSWDNVNLIGNAITGLNPSDIARIDVLKDASATAIYGTRAANGVIVVTTKTGEVGKTSLNYSFNARVTRAPRYDDFEMMTSKERVDVSREIMDKGLHFPYTPQRMGYEGLMMDYWDKKISYGDFQQRVSDMESENADWFGALYHMAFSQSHNVSVSGGNQGTRYYFSFGYTNDKGAEKGTDLARYTARMSLSTRLRENILADIRLSGSVQDADYNPGGYSAFNEAYYMNRSIPVYNPDGSLYYIDKKVNTDRTSQKDIYAKYNILNEFANGGNNVKNKSLNMTVTLNWEILPNLRYVGTVGLTSTTNLTEDWMGEKSFKIAEMRRWDYGDKPAGDIDHGIILDGGTYANSVTSQYAWTVRNQLNYDFTLGEIHHFNMDLGQEARSTMYSGTASGTIPGYMENQGKTFISLPLTGFGTLDYKYYEGVKSWFFRDGGVFPKITDRKENAMSYYGTFTYTLKNIYSINFNIRNDGSNRFGQYKNEKFNPVWSVSGRWNINEENFMDKDWLETLAIRASYGYRGNVPNESPYLLIKKPVKSPVTGELGATVNSFPNANLKWEKTSTVNVGLDWSFIRGRISGALNYYYSKSVDLITERPISMVNGLESEKINDGSATNQGIEVNISTRNIETKNFKWRTSLSYSHNDNKVVRGTKSGSVAGNTYERYLSGSVIRENKSVDGFYSYQFDRLDEQGLPRFKDLTGHPETMSKEEFLNTIFTYSGARTPAAFGSFSTEFVYKRLSLRAEFSYKLGYKVRLLRLYKNTGSIIPFPQDNMNKIMTQRWRNAGDEAYTNVPVLSNIELSVPAMDIVPSAENAHLYTLVDVPFRQYAGPTINTGWYMYDYSDLRVARGDHIRIRSVSMGYDLGMKWLKKKGVRTARLDLQVQNLGVIVFDRKIKGQDPDQVQSVGMPTLPMYNMNISIGF